MNYKTNIAYSGFITNYNCTADCRHCMYCSSSKIKPEYVSESRAAEISEKLALSGVRSMHIGGGEPFLNLNALCGLLRAFKRYGIRVDYIETNAYWCVDETAVKQKLDVLRGLDVDTVMASVDPFHIEFVPLERPLLLKRVSKEVGMECFIWQEKFLSRLIKLDHKRRYTNGELKAALGENYAEETAEEYGLGFNGRAFRLAKNIKRPEPAGSVLSDTPCSNLLNGRHCHVDLYGNVIPAGCPGISISLDDFLKKDLSNAGKYPVASRLYNGGTAALYNYITKFIPSPDGYVSNCELCYSMRDHLLNVKPSADIAPGSFYEAMKLK